MKQVFIDTWGWINLFNRKERHHQQVSQFYKDIRKASVDIVTTDYILDEVYTMLFKRVLFETAQTALETLSQAIEDGYVTLEWITPERFEVSHTLRLKFQDKPDITIHKSCSIRYFMAVKYSSVDNIPSINRSHEILSNMWRNIHKRGAVRVRYTSYSVSCMYFHRLFSRRGKLSYF